MIVEKVEFWELNLVDTDLIMLIQDQTSKTVIELLHRIVGELQHPNPESVVQGGKQILIKLHSQDILLETCK